MSTGRSKDYDFLGRVILLGPEGSGKSTFRRALLGSEEKSEEMDSPTNGLAFFSSEGHEIEAEKLKIKEDKLPDGRIKRTKTWTLEKHRIKLQIFDAPGQSRFQPFVQNYINEKEVVIFVVDCSEDITAEQLDHLRNQRNHIDPHAIPLLICSKADRIQGKIEEEKKFVQRQNHLRKELAIDANNVFRISTKTNIRSEILPALLNQVHFALCAAQAERNRLEAIEKNPKLKASLAAFDAQVIRTKKHISATPKNPVELIEHVNEFSSGVKSLDFNPHTIQRFRAHMSPHIRPSRLKKVIAGLIGAAIMVACAIGGLALGCLGGPAAPATAPLGAIAGGVLGAAIASKLTVWILKHPLETLMDKAEAVHRNKPALASG